MPPGSLGSSVTGGGVLGLERVPTTDCGPITVECWPSRAKMAKKKEARWGGGGGVLLLYCMIGELSEYLGPIFYIK